MLYADLLLILTVGLALCFAKNISANISAVVEEFDRNFRGGGPRPPSHPLPADDSKILNGRRRSSPDA